MVPLYILFLFSLQTAESAQGHSTHTPFYFGAATSAAQVEGCAQRSCAGKGPSIWDDFTKVKGRVVGNADAAVADDSYHKMQADLDMIEHTGLTAYRFSISWPRIFPEGKGGVNQAGVDYYNALIDALLVRNVQPFVTLYHWDLPSALEQQYRGWLGREVVDDFVAYADFCFSTFGDRVKKWITINEPHTFLTMGYISGIHAPGRCSNRTRCAHGDSSTEAYTAGHNVILAHATAVDLYRSQYKSKQNGMIGITLNQDWGEPYDVVNNTDVAAAERRNIFQMAWFADPIFRGQYPQVMVDRLGARLPRFTDNEKTFVNGSTDFLGLNHYSSNYIQSCVASWGDIGCNTDEGTLSVTRNASGRALGPQAASAWLHVAPWGFYNTIMWNKYRYNNPLIFITENGVDVPGEAEMTYEQSWNDTFRINYYNGYLNEMVRAIKNGANIQGYFAWSLVDNFEWSDGYSVRFGLCYVNYSDPVHLQRMPKRSATWYRDYILQSTERNTAGTAVLEESSYTSVPLERSDTFWNFMWEKIANLEHPTLVGMV